MEVFLKIVSAALLLLLLPAIHAAPPKPAVPCRLVLSVGKTGLPELMVTLVNASPDAVGFFINSRNPSLVVEYKAAGSPFSPTGWQRLKSNAEMRRKPGEPLDTETYDVLITVAPKQDYSIPLRLDGFPTAADGYYRITAEVGIPDAGKLTLRSNPLVVKRTAGDFTAISLYDKRMGITPEKNFASTTVTVAKKTWRLQLNVQPVVSFTLIIEGREYKQEAAVLELYKVSSPALNGKYNARPQLVWTIEKTPHVWDPPKAWLGDICVDDNTGQLYLAVSDGNSFEVDITDMSSTTEPYLRRAKYTRVLPADMNKPHKIQRVIEFPRDDSRQFIRWIDHLSLVKRDDDLIATLGSKNQPQQQWSYSLLTQKWTRLTDIPNPNAKGK